MTDGTKILIVGVAAYLLFMRQEAAQASTGNGASTSGPITGGLTLNGNGAANGNGPTAGGALPGGTGRTFVTPPTELFPTGIPQSETGYGQDLPALAGVSL